MANVETLPTLQHKQRKMKTAFVPSSDRTANKLKGRESLSQEEPLETKEEDQGYISSASSSSDVSFDHCGPSSTYPFCEDTCWLRSSPTSCIRRLSSCRTSAANCVTHHEIYEGLMHGIHESSVSSLALQAQLYFAIS
jgi:hypothetical protein